MLSVGTEVHDVVFIEERSDSSCQREHAHATTGVVQKQNVELVVQVMHPWPCGTQSGFQRSGIITRVQSLHRWHYYSPPRKTLGPKELIHSRIGPHRSELDSQHRQMTRGRACCCFIYHTPHAVHSVSFLSSASRPR